MPESPGSPFRITGSAIVTGGGSGIGRATAEALAEAGARVCIADIDSEGAKQTVQLLEERGAQAMFVEADITEAGSWSHVVTRTESTIGTPEILVNNAAVQSRTGLMEISDAEWEKVLQVNLFAAWKLSITVAGRLIELGRPGRIVNLSSSSAFRAEGAHGIYGVSKAAISAMTRILAGELGRHQINVNAVAPGVTATPTVRQLVGGEAELQAATESGPLANLLRRPSVPEDVANAIVFLCAPASRQMTGQVIHTSAGAIVAAG